MLLSEADAKRLKKLGYSLREFAFRDKKGFTRLKNREGYCVFFDPNERQCKIYKNRPLGCRIFPVIFSEEEGIVVDDMCPMKNTVSKRESNHKGKILVNLLQQIDYEAEKKKIGSCLAIKVNKERFSRAFHQTTFKPQRHECDLASIYAQKNKTLQREKKTPRTPSQGSRKKR
jgi:Fe-S-cluster containining protein